MAIWYQKATGTTSVVNNNLNCNNNNNNGERYSIGSGMVKTQGIRNNSMLLETFEPNRTLNFQDSRTQP